MIYSICTVLTPVVVILLAWQCYTLWQTGRQTHYHNASAQRQVHRARVWRVFWIAVVAVALVDSLWQLGPHSYKEHPGIFAFHLVINSASVVVFLTIWLFFPGDRRPRWHKPLVYTFFLLFIISACSGLVVSYELL